MEPQQFDNQPVSNRPFGAPPVGSQGFGSASISVENARFMSRVYGWMTAGLCLTSAVAWQGAGHPNFIRGIFGNQILFWGLFIVQLGLVMDLSGAINKIN